MQDHFNEAPHKHFYFHLPPPFPPPRLSHTPLRLDPPPSIHTSCPVHVQSARLTSASLPYKKKKTLPTPWARRHAASSHLPADEPMLCNQVFYNAGRQNLWAAACVHLVWSLLLPMLQPRVQTYASGNTSGKSE